jgi:hypothetical protein
MRRGAGHNFHHLLKNGAKDDRETEKGEEGAHHETGPAEEAAQGSASHFLRWFVKSFGFESS